MMRRLINYFSVFYKDEYNKSVILNYIFKGTAIILSLLATRIILDYLGSNLYGLWVTITSVISWMSYGDLGIGNGLRNELAKAYGEGNFDKQIQLMKTAFSSISKVAAILFLIIIFLSEFFFHFGILQTEVRIPFYVTAFFFCINLVLGIAQAIALGYQKSWLTTFTTCEMHIFSILTVFALSRINCRPNLVIYAILNGFCITIPNFILLYILEKQDIKISKIFVTKYHDNNNKHSIMKTGFAFFGIQLCGLILYSTDNLIINWKFSSEMVTKYDAISKVYNTGSNLYSVLLVALWSAVTYHIAQDDIMWVKNRIKKLLNLWVVFSCGVVLVSVFINQIVYIWLRENAYHYEWQMILLFGSYCSITAFSAIFVNVLNGMGIIKLQLLLAIICALSNIPLSIFFACNMNMGIIGVKLATFIAVIIMAIFMPMQVIFVLRRRINEQ